MAISNVQARYTNMTRQELIVELGRLQKEILSRDSEIKLLKRRISIYKTV